MAEQGLRPAARAGETRGAAAEWRRRSAYALVICRSGPAAMDGRCLKCKKV